jgi:tetratricopeptide (TPR) repeat protein
LLVGGVLLGSALLLGCTDPASQWPDPATDPTPLVTMKRAIDQGDWQRASLYSNAVAKHHPDDIDILIDLAKVAHVIKQPSQAADFLLQACRAESFHNPQRVQQTMVALVSAGRLFDAMEMLEATVEAEPLDYSTRRTLYDLYVGTENRNASLPHGRFLIQKRQVDLNLLKSIGGSLRRSFDPKPLEEVLTRNPSDRRPLIGAARVAFDAGDYDQAIDLLREIVDAHPTDVPALGLLARALSTAGRFDELSQRTWDSNAELYQEANYWLAIGDWARSQRRNGESARAYWEAAQADHDATEAWTKLSAALRQLVLSGADLPGGALQAVDQRAANLSKYDQLKSRFERTGEISRQIATDIATTLRDLGRWWEAEAWAAMATTLPADETVPVQQVRESIVKLLRKNTPWQVTEQHPELQLDLSYLPLPTVGKSANDDLQHETTSSQTTAINTAKMFLVNEASLRNLNYFGTTSDDLDQPGIMLHETLGCGGAALDFDLDGWSDLYLVAAGGKPPLRDSAPNALFRNLAGNFVNVTIDSRTGDTGFGQGVAVGDVNEDGFADLLVLNYGPNTLLINQGDGTFTESDRFWQTAVDSESWSTSGAIADLDDDGISDMIIVNYCAGLEPSVVTCPLPNSDVYRSCSPMKFPALRDVFFQGQADGSWIDMTKQWTAEPAVPGRGLGIVVGAFDDNPGSDVLIANDMTQNHFWHRGEKDGNVLLIESAIATGLAGDDRSNAQGSMGIATGDLDRDGDIDFYVTNFDREYNTLYEQRNPGVWQDQTATHDLIRPTTALVGFGVEAIDLDRDGQLELILSNGHVDLFSRQDMKSVYAHPMQIFRLDGDRRFRSIEEHVGGEYLRMPHVGRALWTIDANRDHQIDVVVTHQTEPVALLVNRTEPAGSWIDIKLVGCLTARDGIGAAVQVKCGDQHWYTTITAGDGYLCSNETTVQIGLGDAVGRCEVTVTWPNQTQQTWDGLSAGASWLLIENQPSAFELR